MTVPFLTEKKYRQPRHLNGCGFRLYTSWMFPQPHLGQILPSGQRMFSNEFSAAISSGISCINWKTDSHDKLVVKVYTDIFGTEGRYDRLIKFHFADSKDPAQFSKVLCQVIFEAASDAGYQLSSSAIRVWDRHSCTEYKMARVGARMKKDIEAACTAIVALWATL